MPGRVADVFFGTWQWPMTGRKCLDNGHWFALCLCGYSFSGSLFGNLWLQLFVGQGVQEQWVECW